MNEKDVAAYVQGRLASSHELELTPEVSTAIVGFFCEAILLGLLRDGKVLVSSFGAFLAKERGVAVNFRDHESKRMYCISFRPSRKLLVTFRSLLTQGLDFEHLEDGWWVVDAKAGSGTKSKSSSSKDSNPSSQ